MQLYQVLLVLGFSSAAFAQKCRNGVEWYLYPNDCICMNSSNGEILVAQTLKVCDAMKYRTADAGVCMVDKDVRQTFKDLCKALNQESVIGHCR